MKQKEEYAPEWISAEDAAAWLGVDIITLWKWRSSKGLAWSNINNRTIMYDKKQIDRLLNKNSTYQIIGDKKLAI